MELKTHILQSAKMAMEKATGKPRPEIIAVNVPGGPLRNDTKGEPAPIRTDFETRQQFRTAFRKWAKGQ